MSRILHVRGAKTNSVDELRRHYLDLPADTMFPEPTPITDMQMRRTFRDRFMRSSTLTWQSDYKPLSSEYLKRHQSEYRRNLKGWARWVRPERQKRRACLVYVHGWLEPGPWVEEFTLFRKWTRQLDVDIVHVALPFHGRRTPRSALFSGEFFWTADLVRSIEGVRQAIYDVRAVIAWLRTQGYEEVGVSGISLGGALTMILACVEPTPDYIVPIVAHTELEDAVERASILWRMKSDLERWGVDRAQRFDLFRRLGISSYRPLLDRERQLWIQARQDMYLDPALAERQWESWNRPQIMWIPTGHMTFPLYVGAFTKRMARFRKALAEQ